MNTRIYLVSNRDTNVQQLVRAASPAQAIRHAARGKFGCVVAAQESIVELMTDGAKVETAGEDIAAVAQGGAEA